MTFIPARKGDYVAVEIEHYGACRNVCAMTSAPEIKPRTAWHVARVTKASRYGVVREVVMPGYNYGQKLDRLGRRASVMTMPRHQEQAARLFAKITWSDEYESANALRSAILAA